MNERLEKVKNLIDKKLEEKDFIIIAIDGNCTSGKTTLASELKTIYDCNIFHMDDFFLQGHQRTPERLNEIGGNIDYERFMSEVLMPLKVKKPFSYQPFDCSTFSLSNSIEVTPKKINIIEGTYSLHNHFGNIYDLKILLTISKELQKERILKRPSFLHNKFFNEWIPMEDKYFKNLNITIDLTL